MARPRSTLLRTIGCLAALLAATGLPPAARAAGSLGSGNLEQIEACATATADSLLDALGGSDSVCVAIVPHPAAWLLEQAIVERASARSRSVGRCDAADRRRLDVAITDVGVVYRSTDDDAIERTARMSISASAPAAIAESGATGMLRTVRIERQLVDTIAAADTIGASIAAYPYTVGVVASAGSGSFWQRIVEPAVVLAASAIVAILLFTVRSQ
jgi:hypothetical protein